MTARELKRAGALFLIAALAFLYPLLKGNAHFVGDITYSFQPWLTYAAQEIQAGRFPLWNPYSACGELFVGNPQIMLFNPTAALFWIFPFTTANGLFLFLSQALLFFFTYLLARRWAGRRNPGQAHLHAPAALAALAFAWGGFTVSQWEFPSAVGTLPFLPLLFLLGLGEFWVALSVGVALAFTAGYVQFVHYGVFLAVAGAAHAAITRRPFHRWTARWSPLIWVGVALGAGILLSLAQILPSWEMARQSFRAALSPAEARHFSLAPIFLLKLWVPWITNTTALVFQQVPFGPEFWPIQRSWLSTLFLGTGVCLLSIVGILRTPFRKTLTLGTVALAAGILAFGVEPFFGWARSLVPGFRYLTHFANASVLGLLCLTLWSTEGAHQRRGRNALLALVTLGLLGISLGLTFFTGIRALALRWLLGLATLNPA
ncbi:MAG: hypothetical protein IPP35_08290 [Elusimicrobia bacterium]|nr:hypothetical protein [Elusimicrobiota bacterium]